MDQTTDQLIIQRSTVLSNGYVAKDWWSHMQSRWTDDYFDTLHTTDFFQEIINETCADLQKRNPSNKVNVIHFNEIENS